MFSVAANENVQASKTLTFFMETQILSGGKFGYALDQGRCVQLGTHGSLTKVNDRMIYST
jgi:hypothetical protein